jgi:hypothetical protein
VKKPRVRVTYANCTVLTSFDSTCPLCGATCKANEVHQCERQATPSDVGRMLAETFK